MKNVLLIAFISLSIISCKKKIYHSFTDEERAFMVYDQGEQFKLKNENTGEIIKFTVTSKKIEFKDDYGPSLGPSRKEHFMEEGRIEFDDGTRHNTGYIYIYKDKRNDFSIGLSFLKYPDFSFRASGESAADSVEDITIDNASYTKVERFNDIYFSKEYGFVKLEHSVLDVLLTRVP